MTKVDSHLILCTMGTNEMPIFTSSITIHMCQQASFDKMQPAQSNLSSVLVKVLKEVYRNRFEEQVLKYVTAVYAMEYRSSVVSIAKYTNAMNKIVDRLRLILREARDKVCLGIAENMKNPKEKQQLLQEIWNAIRSAALPSMSSLFTDIQSLELDIANLLCNMNGVPSLIDQFRDILNAPIAIPKTAFQNDIFSYFVIGLNVWRKERNKNCINQVLQAGEVLIDVVCSSVERCISSICKKVELRIHEYKQQPNSSDMAALMKVFFDLQHLKFLYHGNELHVSTQVVNQGAFAVVLDATLNGKAICVKKMHNTMNDDLIGVYVEIYATRYVIDSVTCVSAVQCVANTSHYLGCRKTDSSYEIVFRKYVTDMKEFLQNAGMIHIVAIHSMLCKLARIITKLHHLGFVHRDIKLENILLSEDCHIFLADFGITKHMNLMLKSFCGTTGYMDEKLTGKLSASEDSDAFSFGCLIKKILLEYCFCPSHLKDDLQIMLYWASKYTSDMLHERPAILSFVKLYSPAWHSNPFLELSDMEKQIVRSNLE